MNKESLMNEIMAVEFAIYDLNLYLDTHPNDCKMIGVFNNCVTKAKELREEYQQKYGPIVAGTYVSGTPWKWINNPWPWDNDFPGEMECDK